MNSELVHEIELKKIFTDYNLYNHGLLHSVCTIRTITKKDEQEILTISDYILYFIVPKYLNNLQITNPLLLFLILKLLCLLYYNEWF